MRKSLKKELRSTTISPRLNNIFCYISNIGHWKDLTPKSVINDKRIIDKMIYTNSSLFSDILEIKYKKFIDICFKERQQAGKEFGDDAQLNAFINRYEVEGPTGERHLIKRSIKWNSAWDALFYQGHSDQKKSPNEKDTIVEKTRTGLKLAYINLKIFFRNSFEDGK